MAIKLYASCKLCTLINKDPDLWWEVHRKIFEAGASHGAVMGWLNSRIEIKNKELPEEEHLVKFNRTNFYNHFTRFSHVKSVEAARDICATGFEMQGRSNKNSKRLSKVWLPKKLETHTTLNQNATDFQRMRDLIAAAEVRLHSFNNQMSEKEMKEGAKHKVDLQEVALFQKLVTELLKLQKEAANVESSSKVAGSALKDAMSLLVGGILEKVESTSDEIHGILTREMPGSRLPDQISTLLRARIGTLIKQAVPQVFTTIEARYGIK